MCRVYSTYATLCREFEGYPGHREALEKAVAAAEGDPSEDLATALATKAMWHLRQEQFAAAIECADRSVEVAQAVPVPVIESLARQLRSQAYYALGRMSDAAAEAGAAARAAERPGGSPAYALASELFQAEVLLAGLDPARGLTLARDLRARAQAQWNAGAGARWRLELCCAGWCCRDVLTRRPCWRPSSSRKATRRTTRGS